VSHLLPSSLSSSLPSNLLDALSKQGNRKRILARQERTGITPLFRLRSPTHGLEVNDIISYACPVSNKMHECVVTDLGMSRVRGQWFEVVYSDDPNVKVVLNSREMEEILGHHAMAT
jgi:hypothetical protein